MEKKKPLEQKECGKEGTEREKEAGCPAQKALPFAPNTPRIQPSTLKIFLMTLGVIGVMLLIGWVRSKIGR